MSLVDGANDARTQSFVPKLTPERALLSEKVEAAESNPRNTFDRGVLNNWEAV